MHWYPQAAPILDAFMDQDARLSAPLDIVVRLYNCTLMVLLDTACFALADPTRRAILVRLARGEATVTELCEPFAISQPAISRHLKVLETARLIERRVHGTRRPCRLNDAGLQALEQWLSLMRDAMARNYDRLDGVLVAMQAVAPATPSHPPAPHRRTPR